MSVLNAEHRSSDRPVNLRALRRTGVVPMAIIEKGKGTVPIQASEKEIRDVLRQSQRQFQIKLAGETKPRDVILTKIDRDPFATRLIHVSVMQVAETDVVTVDLNIVVHGVPEIVGQHEATLLTPTTTVRAKGMVKDIPEQLELDVAHLQLNEAITVGELTLPPGIEVLAAPETVVATVKLLKVVEEAVEEAPAEEGAEGGAEAAGEAEAAPEA